MNLLVEGERHAPCESLLAGDLKTGPGLGSHPRIDDSIARKTSMTWLWAGRGPSSRPELSHGGTCKKPRPWTWFYPFAAGGFPLGVLRLLWPVGSFSFRFPAWLLFGSPGGFSLGFPVGINLKRSPKQGNLTMSITLVRTNVFRALEQTYCI